MLLESLIFLLFLISWLFLSDYFAQKHSTRNMQAIPCISKLPVLGTLLAMSSLHPNNLHLKCNEFVQRFGKTFCGRVFGLLFVITTDERYVEKLLHSQKHTHKSIIYTILEGWLGDGLILSYGQHWQTMRKIITPTFHFKILEEFMKIFDRQSSVLVQELQKFADGKTVVNFFSHMKLAALDSIAESAMGVQLNAQLNAKSKFVEAVDDVTNILTTRIIYPYIAYPFFFRLFAPTLYKKHQMAIATMHEFTDNIIKKRREALKNLDLTYRQAEVNDLDGYDNKKHSALLDVLLQSNIDGEPLTDNQIRDEVNTFLFGGHDATTSAISMSLYLLSRNADVQQKLFEELYNYFGTNRERPIGGQDLQNLTYLNAVVKESLRVYPPIPVIGRLLKEDCVLADATIPAGTNIIILIWELLHDPVVFPEPLQFKPERHLESNPRAHAFSNIAFSAGPRNCIGKRYAEYEMKIFIIKMLFHFELLPQGPDVEPCLTVVLKSKTGVNFGLKPRLY